MRNPWQRRSLPDEQGCAVVTVAREATLARDVKMRWTQPYVEALVRRAAEGASIVFQVGITREWGREPSMQVVMLNGSTWVQPWPTFERLARSVAESLARDLAQQEVILELLRTDGRYRIERYVNPSYKRQRRVLAHAIKSRSRRQQARR